MIYIYKLFCNCVDNLLLLPTRDKWNLDSTEDDFHSRNQLVKVIMDSLAKFKYENDMAFTFFNAIIEAQKCLRFPISKYIKLMLLKGILFHIS